MLATMLHQWSGRYIMMAQQLRYSPQREERFRAFFSGAVNGFPVILAVEWLRVMIHISLFLFFAGLTIFLLNTNITVFGIVVWWMALSAIAYMCITCLPIFHPNTPCYTPLSLIIGFLYTGVPYLVFKTLSSLFVTNQYFEESMCHYHHRLLEGMRKTVRRMTRELSSEIRVRVLISTYDALDEDTTREKFFEAIPEFFGLLQVHALEEHLNEFRNKLKMALDGFLDRTFSSNTVSESDRSSRLIVCLNAAHAALRSDDVSQILFDILNGRWRGPLQSVEMAHSLRKWGKSTNDEFTPFVRRIVTQVAAGVRERDDRWISLIKAEFGVPDHVLCQWETTGDSVLLSLLIHITREAFRSGSWMPFILASFTQFDVRDTHPELQHEFCALWNEIVQEAWRSRADGVAINILCEIRHAYIGLHQGTDAAPTAFSSRTYHFDPILAEPLSYRFCTITSHRPDRADVHQAPDITVPPSTGDGIPSLPHSTAQLGDVSNIFPQFPSSVHLESMSRSSAYTPTHRHTFSSLSPSTSPVPIEQQVTSVFAPSVLASVGSEPAAMRERTVDRPRNTFVPTEVSVSLHASRQPALPASDIVANGVQHYDSTNRIYPIETEETSQAPVSTSHRLSSPEWSPDSPTDPPSGPHVASFSDPDSVHTSPRPTHRSSPADTPLDMTLTAASRTLGRNDPPDTATPSAKPCGSKISSTVKFIPQSIPPSCASPTVIPSIIVFDSPILLPTHCDDMIPAELHSLRSTSPSPINADLHSPPQTKSVLGVHGTMSTRMLNTPDGTRDLYPPTQMESASPVPDAEDRQHG